MAKRPRSKKSTPRARARKSVARSNRRVAGRASAGRSKLPLLLAGAVAVAVPAILLLRAGTASAATSPSDAGTGTPAPKGVTGPTSPSTSNSHPANTGTPQSTTAVHNTTGSRSSASSTPPAPPAPTPPPTNLTYTFGSRSMIDTQGARRIALLRSNATARLIYYVQEIFFSLGLTTAIPDGIQGSVTDGFVRQINTAAGFPGASTRVSASVVAMMQGTMGVLAHSPSGVDPTPIGVVHGLPQDVIDLINHDVGLATAALHPGVTPMELQAFPS